MTSGLPMNQRVSACSANIATLALCPLASVIRLLQRSVVVASPGPFHTHANALIPASSACWRWRSSVASSPPA